MMQCLHCNAEINGCLNRSCGKAMVLSRLPLDVCMDVQAGGTWANSAGLGWAISSMGLSRPAAQGAMSSASSGAPVPPGAASVSVPAVSTASAPQAMHLRH